MGRICEVVRSVGKSSVIALMGVLMVGCGSSKLANVVAPEAVEFKLAADKTVVDSRARFRQALCTVVEQRRGQYPDERDCQAILHDLGDEPALPGAWQLPAASAQPSNLTVILVSGVLWECVSGTVNPFGAGKGEHASDADYDYLKPHFPVVEVVKVAGRASSKHNGGLVADAIRTSVRHHPGNDIVVVAYSKGAADTLEALRQLGEANAVPTNLKALVTTTGAIYGSPLGDELDGPYKTLLSRLPWPSCQPVDDKPIESISRRVRMQWMADHWQALPKGIRYYSLGVYDKPENQHWALSLLSKHLARYDARNDSHMIYSDQILPDSQLLGYIKADHWSFVLPFNRNKSPLWRPIFNDHNAFPREVLLETLLRYVEADMAEAGAAKSP